jgi:hypothetical protein
MIRYQWEGRQFVLHTDEDIRGEARDILASGFFALVVNRFCGFLHEHESPLVEQLLPWHSEDGDWSRVVATLKALATAPLEQVAEFLPYAASFLESGNRRRLHEFVEGLYDYWRSFDRYLVLHSIGEHRGLDRRPFRSFNINVDVLAHRVRGIYRDICENITGDHPRVYRQVPAGMNVGLIATMRGIRLPEPYREIIEGIPIIRQVWIDPPMIIDPPTNTRTGQFEKVEVNPVEGLKLNKDEWLMFPARVGPLVILVCFHQMFIGLGCSLANLFDLASDEQIEEGPDAIYFFGVPPRAMDRFGELPTVFFDDRERGLLVAAVPGEERFGYFGYLKKMILTLHNVVMMHRGRMPFHGAMFRIALRGGASASILIIGDTATGKSESLEAFRRLAGEKTRELRIVADDMGSIEVRAGAGIVAFGTEIGAFVRLDDLQPGFAFDMIDRAIIMSPHKVNARVVLPVTTQEDVMEGYPVDFLLYANNYEEVDADHPIVERFDEAGQALEVFRAGVAMTKGTTSSTGIVRSYFANIFGPPQYREVHERLAIEVFAEAFASGVFVGQIRTRLGVEGYEACGPQETAEALLDLIQTKRR